MASDLQRLVTVGELMVSLERAVEQAEASLQRAKAELRTVQDEDLPELMMELGISMFELSDGTRIEVKPEVQCAITDATRARAHSWLTANGFGGLIKTVVTASFGKGEHEQAVEAAAKIGGELKETVHPATLKSFVKERLAAASEAPLLVPPADLFNLHPFTRAKATKTK